jgi:hypothetical protein
MRTTVTLDEDVVQELRRVMRSEEKPFKEALNDALRRGLRLGDPESRNRRFCVRPHDSPFRAGFDADKLNQLADELEDF